MKRNGGRVVKQELLFWRSGGAGDPGGDSTACDAPGPAGVGGDTNDPQQPYVTAGRREPVRE